MTKLAASTWRPAKGVECRVMLPRVDVARTAVWVGQLPLASCLAEAWKAPSETGFPAQFLITASRRRHHRARPARACRAADLRCMGLPAGWKTGLGNRISGRTSPGSRPWRPMDNHWEASLCTVCGPGLNKLAFRPWSEMLSNFGSPAKQT
ncbi:Uncharacterised protein [Bordetella pertussis]|nr:Uncharacterised protein [Bordetella pertussis]